MSVQVTAGSRRSPMSAQVAAESERNLANAQVTVEVKRSPVSVSVIVPVFNEASTIDSLQDHLDCIDFVGECCEVIFVDGGSTDGTRNRVRSPYRLIDQEGRGRGGALNTGARAAKGDVLFFLHCDSVLPEGAFREIDEVLSRTRVGSFGIRFNKLTPVLLLCQGMSNLRVKFRHISFGDQGLFIERDLFFEAGMFPDMPLMEDFQFALNLKLLGEPLGMTRHRIRTSARRFPKGELNRLRTWVSMARLRSRYLKGASPEELARAYGNVR